MALVRVVGPGPQIRVEGAKAKDREVEIKYLIRGLW